MTQYHVMVPSHSDAGTKQVSLRAVFVPASLRLRDADSFMGWQEGSVPRRRATVDGWNMVEALGVPRGTRPSFRMAIRLSIAPEPRRPPITSLPNATRDSVVGHSYRPPNRDRVPDGPRAAFHMRQLADGPRNAFVSGWQL